MQAVLEYVVARRDRFRQRGIARDRKCGERGWRKEVRVESEDWAFSRWLHAQGAAIGL